MADTDLPTDEQTVPDTEPQTEEPTDAAPDAAPDPDEEFSLDPASLLDRAPAEDETPAEEAAEPEATETTETPEEGEATDDAADVAAEPEPAAEETPNPQAPSAAAGEPPAPKPDPAQTRAARMAEIQRELDALDAKGGEFDPFEDGPKERKLNREFTKLQNEEIRELKALEAERAEANAIERHWQDWARKNPDVGDKGRTIFAEEVARLEKKYPGITPDALQFAATEAWTNRVNLVRGQARAAAAKKTPAAKPAPATPAAKGGARPVTRGGAKLVPGGAPVKAAAPPRTAEDVLANTIAPGIRGLLD